MPIASKENASSQLVQTGQADVPLNAVSRRQFCWLIAALGGSLLLPACVPVTQDVAEVEQEPAHLPQATTTKELPTTDLTKFGILTNFPYVQVSMDELASGLGLPAVGTVGIVTAIPNAAIVPAETVGLTSAIGTVVALIPGMVVGAYGVTSMQSDIEGGPQRIFVYDPHSQTVSLLNQQNNTIESQMQLSQERDSVTFNQPDQDPRKNLPTREEAWKRCGDVVRRHLAMLLMQDVLATTMFNAMQTNAPLNPILQSPLFRGIEAQSVSEQISSHASLLKQSGCYEYLDENGNPTNLHREYVARRALRYPLDRNEGVIHRSALTDRYGTNVPYAAAYDRALTEIMEMFPSLYSPNH